MKKTVVLSIITAICMAASSCKKGTGSDKMLIVTELQKRQIINIEIGTTVGMQVTDLRDWPEYKYVITYRDPKDSLIMKYMTITYIDPPTTPATKDNRGTAQYEFKAEGTGPSSFEIAKWNKIAKKFEDWFPITFIVSDEK